MATLMDGQSIFVRDCITFNHPMGDIVKGVVVKFFQKDNSVDLLEEIDVLANLQQFQYLVPDTTATHLSSDTLILCETIVLPVFSILGTVECPEDIIKWTPPGMFSRIDVEVGRNLDPCAICSRRTQQQTLQQIMEIRRQPTEVAKARLRTLYGLNEDDNDLLDALCDLFQSHIVLLCCHLHAVGYQQPISIEALQQSDSSYNIFMDNLVMDQLVTSCAAIVSLDSSLVNVGDYIEMSSVCTHESIVF
eukprot:Em0017g569a